MKILHTSDWHIGRILHNEPLDEDFTAFIGWLTEVIQEQGIDVLVISGDIFDVAYPSARAQKMYYQALSALTTTRLKKLIIIAGNHDSAVFLKAPYSVLQRLNVVISAGFSGNLEEYIIPIPEQEPQVVIVSVPFLRQVDLLRFYREAYGVEQMQNGIAMLYQRLFEMTEQYRRMGVKVIATGHLYVVDGGFDQIDRENYSLGGLVDMPSEAFPPFDYIALGHVHRPMSVGQRPIYYSGTPFFMGFNDLRQRHRKKVLIYDTEKAEVKEVNTPMNRVLEKFQGPFDQVFEQIKSYKAPGTRFPTLAQVVLTEYPDITARQLIDTLRQAAKEYLLLVDFKIPPKVDTSKFITNQLRSLSEQSELDVFRTYLKQIDLAPQQQQLLLDAYKQLVEEVKFAE